MKNTDDIESIDALSLMQDFLPPGDDELNKRVQFSIDVDEMKNIVRRTLLIDKSRRENDAEHSWHVALMALLFSSYTVEQVNVDRSVKMLVVHDLVELYAGDTFAYDAVGNKSRVQREMASADTLFCKLPMKDGKELRGLWEEFEAAKTSDAKYALCIDRLQPFIHNLKTQGHTWVIGNVTRSMVEERLSIIKDFMPLVYKWVSKCIDNACKKGYLKDV